MLSSNYEDYKDGDDDYDSDGDDGDDENDDDDDDDDDDVGGIQIISSNNLKVFLAIIVDIVVTLHQRFRTSGKHNTSQVLVQKVSTIPEPFAGFETRL